ncbi:glycosyltransferase [Paludibacter sp. 221]|uniref:glycosyltransferase family 2 protein n=1 Tax=Paludibacter sp. 221 TaxID=2302939 RepID=UPI0013D1593E|nr:glycosyltransferase family 2 protein [Paludibacter sp. 221]NDV46030.1 glycosyltransferase [Paludibacter sp. 221]
MKLSVITINLNNDVGLKKTIDSVVSQSFKEFEYIIIDGSSTDESVNIIKQNEDNINYWLSESDSGIYNAMNKGIRQAKGEYCLFLNSGDYLIDETVLHDFVYSKYVEDIISGNVLLLKSNEKELIQSVETENISFEVFYKSYIPHPSSFIRRELFFVYGFYNENFKIVSDWEFFFKVLIIHQATYRHFERIVAVYDFSGISSLEENQLKVREERETVFMKHMPLIYESYVKLETELLLLKKECKQYLKIKNKLSKLF